MTATLPAKGLAPSASATRVAVVAALSATTMLFASLISAYVVRRSFTDWVRPSFAVWPWILLSLALIASFGTEIACRTNGGHRSQALRGVAVSGGFYFAIVAMVIASIMQDPQGLGPPQRAFVALLLGAHLVHALLGTVFSVSLLKTGAGATEDANFLARLVIHFLGALLCVIILLLFVVQ